MVADLKLPELLNHRMNSPSLKVFNYSLESVRDPIDEVQVLDKQLVWNSEVLQANLEDTDPELFLWEPWG